MRLSLARLQTTDHHSAHRKAIRWIPGRKVLHRRSQYLNNRTEQDHRAVRQHAYPMLGFGRFASVARFRQLIRAGSKLPVYDGDAVKP